MHITYCLEPVNDVCVYGYIECITDQSNWSGPFSLVVVCLFYNLGVVSSMFSWSARGNILCRFFSSYYSKKKELHEKCKKIHLIDEANYFRNNFYPVPAASTAGPCPTMIARPVNVRRYGENLWSAL